MELRVVNKFECTYIYIQKSSAMTLYVLPLYDNNLDGGKHSCAKRRGAECAVYNHIIKSRHVGYMYRSHNH